MSCPPAAAAGLPYLLSAAEVHSASADPEPNDVADRAVPLGPGVTSVRGRLAAHADRDIFRLPVDAAVPPASKTSCWCHRAG